MCWFLRRRALEWAIEGFDENFGNNPLSGYISGFLPSLNTCLELLLSGLIKFES